MSTEQVGCVSLAVPQPRDHEIQQGHNEAQTSHSDTHLPPPKPALHIFHSPPATGLEQLFRDAQSPGRQCR